MAPRPAQLRKLGIPNGMVAVALTVSRFTLLSRCGYAGSAILPADDRPLGLVNPSPGATEEI